MTLFDKMVKITIITKNTIFCISYLGPNFFADSDPPMFSEAKTTNQSRTRAFRPASASHAHQPPPSSSEQSRVNIDHQLSRDSGDLVHPCNSFHPGHGVHGARLGLSAARPVQLPSVGSHLRTDDHQSRHNLRRSSPHFLPPFILHSLLRHQQPQEQPGCQP